MDEHFSTEWSDIFRYTDKVMIGIILLLFCAGLAAIYSASITFTASGKVSGFVVRQIFWGILSSFVYLTVVKIDYRNLLRHIFPMFAIMTLVFLMLLFIGHSAKGAQRWLNLGFFKFQPSELGKIIFALALAKITTLVPPHNLNSVALIWLLACFFILPVALQPDFGTSLVFVAMLFAVLIAGCTPIKILAGIVCFGLSTLPFVWMCLKPYQKMRIMVFINPSVDPQGAGYNVIQSRIAVGSGGFWGKGFLQGTQGKLHFLPEQHTDFIFSVFSEEFGFFGCCIVILLFALLFWKILEIAAYTRDNQAKLMCVAICAWLWFQTTESIAMSMGLAPVTGLPLPLFSYGGSSLIVVSIGLALVQSAHIVACKDRF